MAGQTRESVHEARALCERVLELDPAVSNLAALCSLTHLLDCFESTIEGWRNTGWEGRQSIGGQVWQRMCREPASNVQHAPRRKA